MCIGIVLILSHMWISHHPYVRKSWIIYDYPLWKGELVFVYRCPSTRKNSLLCFSGLRPTLHVACWLVVLWRENSQSFSP